MDSMVMKVLMKTTLMACEGEEEREAERGGGDPILKAYAKEPRAFYITSSHEQQALQITPRHHSFSATLRDGRPDGPSDPPRFREFVRRMRHADIQIQYGTRHKVPSARCRIPRLLLVGST